jgi:hypothetical protein
MVKRLLKSKRSKSHTWAPLIFIFIIIITTINYYFVMPSPPPTTKVQYVSPFVSETEELCCHTNK